MTRAKLATQRQAPPLAARGSADPLSAGPLTQRGRDTRAKLLGAAREVFSRSAFSDVRVTDITAEAGVASGTFYTYFDSKEEVFREIASQVLEEMSAVPRGGPEHLELSPAQQIEAATRRYFDCVRRNACIARSIEEMQTRESGVGGARRSVLIFGVKRIARWIRKLQDQGICDPALEPWPVALALQAMNVSIAYDHLVHRNAPEETELLLAATMRIWRATLGLRD